MRIQRAAIAPEERQQAADGLLHAGLSLLASRTPGIIGGYAPRYGEIDVMPLLLELARRGWNIALPRIADTSITMQFHRWNPGEPLPAQHYGIPAPAPQAAQCQPDLLLVPLLAFDLRGHRLGYGKGFYDTYLDARSERPITLGCAYDFQQQERLPEDPHDVALDALLLPGRALKISGRLSA